VPKFDDDSVGSLETLAELVNNLALEEGLKGPLAGLKISKASNTTITIAAGTTTKFKQWLTSSLTKSAADDWVAGDGNGGMSTGEREASTWYYVFLILKSSTGDVDAGFDTSLTAVNLLAASGYDKYRLLGGFFTSINKPPANILGFFQDGEEFKWQQPIDYTLYDTDPGLGTRTEYVLTHVPLGVRVEAIVHPSAVFSGTAGGNCVIYATDLQMTDTTPDAGTTAVVGNGFGQVGGSRTAANNSFAQGEIRVMTDIAQTIGISAGDNVDDNPDDFGMRVHGYNWLGLRGPVLADSN
jgi:hypothetical protein